MSLTCDICKNTIYDHPINWDDPIAITGKPIIKDLCMACAIEVSNYMHKLRV